MKSSSESNHARVSIFASESTIHAVQYIFDPARKILIRIFWMLTFITSICFCVMSARGNYIKFLIEPEHEISINQKLSYEVPFPAVTICTRTFAKLGLANYFDSLHEMITTNKLKRPVEEMKFLVANAHRANPYHVGVILMMSNFSENFDIYDYLDRSQYTIDEFMSDCLFQDKLVKCSNIFDRVLTPEGICFTYNRLNFDQIFQSQITQKYKLNEDFLSRESQWTIGGYRTQNMSSFPVRASQENTLQLSLNIPKNDATNFFGSGNFLVVIHKPNEIFEKNLQSVGIGKEKTFYLSAKISSHTNDLRKFKPINRGCFFDGERGLKYFKSYTEENCLRECLANYTFKVCRCVQFSMPRNDSTPVCFGEMESRCYDDTIYGFPPDEIGTPPCGCLKSCNDVSYFVKKESKKILDKYSQGKVSR